MENENDFRIRTYTKRELACLYCPNTTARCAIRTLTRWIKRNSELYAELLLTGYHARVRTFMPRQVNNRPLPERTLIEGRFLGYTDMLDGNERGRMYLMFFFWYAPLLFLMAFICIFPALFVPLPLSIKKRINEDSCLYSDLCGDVVGYFLHIAE